MTHPFIPARLRPLMTWGAVYLGSFVLGGTFVLLSALLGKFAGMGDGGHGGDVSADPDGGHDGGKIGLPPFSPMVLSVFAGMFGAGGLILHRGLGIQASWLHVPGAATFSLASGLLV